jgi:hypothetical protein
MIKPSLFMLGFCLAVTPLYAVPISLSIVDESGAPIEKAKVQLESFDSETTYTLSESGADGVAHFDIEPSRQYPDFFGSVAVWKQGYALAGFSSLTSKKPLTIVLKKGESLRGVVLDNAKKPVQGAKVTYSKVDSDDWLSIPKINQGPLLAKVQVVTDENGAWQLDNLPQDVPIIVSVLASRFSLERPSGKTGETIQTELRIGASAHGKLLGLDGKPLAGVRVHAQPVNGSVSPYGYAETKTTIDGQFDLEGLETGTFNIMFQVDRDRDYVVPALENIRLVNGDSKVLPEIKALEGILIGGKISEKGSDKPLAHVQIGVHGALNPSTSASVSSAISDEQGLWKMRMLPGKSQVYVMGIPTGFVSDQQLKNLEISPQGDPNINFELERAPKVSGKLVDETGKGIAATIYVTQRGNEWPVSSDESGEFEVVGPKAGEVEFGYSMYSRWVQRANIEAWDIIGNPKRTIPAMAPIEIKLTKAKLSRFEARVYDDGDLPLEGATVNVTIMTGERYGEPRKLVSGKDGLVRIERLRTNQSVTVDSANKSGYDLISKLSEKKTGDVWLSADIILKKRGGALKGQVFDSKGQAVAGARVFAGGTETITDKSGGFVFEQLPDGKNDVVALKDDEFAQISTDKEARIELKKSVLQGVDKIRALQILNEVKELSKDTKYSYKDALQLLGEIDYEVAAATALERKDTGVTYLLIQNFGANPDIGISRWASLLASHPKVSDRLYLSTALARKRFELQDDEATRNWLEALKSDAERVVQTNDTNNKWPTSIGLFGVAMIAEQINDTKGANKALMGAIAYVIKNYSSVAPRGEKIQSDVFDVVGELIGVSPRLLNLLLEQIEPESKAYSRIMSEAIPQIARRVGLDAVQPLLVRLKNAPSPPKNEKGISASIEWAYQFALIKSIQLASQSNPQLAIQMAKSLPLDHDKSRERALIQASFFQEKLVAESLWRENVPLIDSTAAMKTIVKIARTDEKLARELYETKRADFEVQRKIEWGEDGHDIPSIVFYESKFNPAAARYRLEKGFMVIKKNKGENYRMGQYTRAMSVFDAERALEWANQLSNENSYFAQFEAKRGIALWLGTNETLRAKADFAPEHGLAWEF